MKSIRENWLFVLLAMIAFFLVLMLFSLQSAILRQQTEDVPPAAGPFYLLRRQIANFIAPATVTPTPSREPATLAVVNTDPTAIAPPPPAATAAIASLATAPPPPPPPSPTPLPTPSDTPSPLPTDTATAPPTETETPLPTPTPTAALVTLTVAPATAAVAADGPAPLRLGYLERNDRCTLVTEIVGQLLVERLGLAVERVAFVDADSLFATLAATDPQQRVDLTLCFTDPVDRPYLQKHVGFVLLVGSAYRQTDNASFLMVSNASIKTVIQREQPCVYALLTRFRIVERDLSTLDAAGWLAGHQSDLASWITC